MSGTSADGVDVALVEITGRGLEMSAKLLHHHARRYEAGLRQRIFAVREAGHITLAELAGLGRDISLSYAHAVNAALLEANLKARDVAAIAAHGQTLYHAPPETIQWFDPALVAAEVGCAVVSDFRRADCAAGGQGAPLVPFVDYVLFRHATKNRVLLNVGGIANLTYIPAGATLDQVIAFDTGPGNCISDWICRTRGPFGMSWDIDGAGASRGKVLAEPAERFLGLPFFAAAPPKSTDGPAMIAAFQNAVRGIEAEMNDLLATAAYVTGTSLIRAIKPRVGLEIIVSGGGTRNKAMMGWIRSGLPDHDAFRILDSFGMVSAAKEALAFALLGAATLDGIPSNVPSATGAKRAVVLGSITPKP